MWTRVWTAAWACLLAADDILRGRLEEELSDRPGRALARLLASIAAFGAAYGATMGSFGGLTPDGLRQMLASALKVPVLLLTTTLLSLPSFFVLNTLLGVRDDFPRALRTLLSGQAALTMTLAALAPITMLWYASTTTYRPSILFNALIFTVASLGAQVLLRRSYRPLIAARPRHRALLRIWLVVYAFAGIQMGWLLRPFIGNPEQPFQAFREDAWGNAYVIVVGMIWEQIRRLSG